MTNRQTILKATLDVFTEVGVAKASLSQIAEKAGCETASVRALFVDTNTLLRELLEDVSTPLLSAISMAVEKFDQPREMLKESLRLYDNWLTENPQYVRLIQRCLLDDPAALSIVLEKSMYPSEYYERFEAWIKDGRIKAKDTFSLVLILDSIMMMPHFIHAAGEQMTPGDPGEVYRLRFETLWGVLENGLFVD